MLVALAFEIVVKLALDGDQHGFMVLTHPFVKVPHGAVLAPAHGVVLVV
jgi:hypothetical protein